MGSQCGSCCAADNTLKTMPDRKTTVNFTVLAELHVPDEKALKKLASLMAANVTPDMITAEICAHASVP